jgi:drug/metabolite transporter (DMT)-like permease
MNLTSALKLLFLSMVWGASFLFMRVAAPEFGPIPLMLFRVSVAALVMLPILLPAESRAAFRKNFAGIAFVGIMNSALPFCLLAYATLSLEAGFTSLLNATTPLFAALVGTIWFRLPLKSSQIWGLMIAFMGIALLSGDRLEFKAGGSGWAIVASLVATLSYGLSANFSKARLSGVPPKVVAAGGMLPATLVLLPLGIWFWPSATPSLLAWGCALTLAILGTAIAHVIYFELIAKTGAMAATTVTFLIPVFGILWGSWFLDEAMGVRLLGGMLITLAGTALCVGLIKRKLLTE